MNLTHLKYFTLVAENSSFSRAAQLAGVSQPAVSTAVKRLEEEFNAALIARTKDGLQLTPVGHNVLENARALLANAENMQSEVKRIKNLEAGSLSIGVRTHFLTDVMEATLNGFSARNPRVQLRVLTASHEKLHKELLNDEIDVLIHYSLSRDSDKSVEIENELLFDDPLMFFMRADHPEANKAKLPISTIEKYPHLYSRKFAESDPQLARILAETGFLAAPPVIDISDKNLMGNLAANSDRNYLIVTPYHFFESYVREGRLVAVPLEKSLWKQPVMASFRSKRLLSPAARTFIADLKEVLEEANRKTAEAKLHPLRQ